MLVTLPESPYKVLDVAYDADSKTILSAMRALFRRDPQGSARKGNIAQRKLADPKERIKEDAFCCEAALPEVDLGALGEKLAQKDLMRYCHLLENPLLLSDAYFPDVSEVSALTDDNERETLIPYRSRFDRAKS
jgi:hypothetical protein